MSAMKAWFDARSLREKRLLLIMAALALLTVIWGGIVRPVGDALSGTRERHADAVMRLGETAARIDALRDGQRRRPPPMTGTLAEATRAYAADAGFALASLDEPAPDRVRIGIQSARPAALTQWLARLERGGILIEQATLTDNGDRTVGVTLLLAARAS